MKIDLCIGKNAKHVLQTLPLKIEMFFSFKSSSLLQSHKKFHKTCPISCMNQNPVRTLTIKKSNHVIIEGLSKPPTRNIHAIKITIEYAGKFVKKRYCVQRTLRFFNLEKTFSIGNGN